MRSNALGKLQYLLERSGSIDFKGVEAVVEQVNSSTLKDRYVHFQRVAQDVLQHPQKSRGKGVPYKRRTLEKTID